MGGFANSMFQFLLGWTRTLLSSLWDTAADPEGNGLLTWIGGHWIGLLVILCLVGAAADLVIYLIRWQPYKVWASFFRRRRNRSAELPAEAPAAPAREAAFRAEPPEAEPAAAAEPMPAEPLRAEAYRDDGLFPPPEEKPAAPRWTWDKPAGDREDSFGSAGEAGHRGYQAAKEEEPSEPGRENDDLTVTARFEQAIRPRRRRARVTELFSEDRPEAEYTAPQELIDRREAYHKPVYPRSWKGNNSSET